jgi:hypothetical protein
MKPSSLRRIDNLRRLVAALAHGRMSPAAVAALLQVSHRAARNYLDELERAGVAQCDPDRRTCLRLRPDPVLTQRFLASLAEPAKQHLALRRSQSRHNANPGERFLHVLADDVRFPLVLSQHPARRDPLVAALFGAAAGVSVR